jgi:prepilin-type N-terminal cleavage/methylation domain-containing protein
MFLDTDEESMGKTFRARLARACAGDHERDAGLTLIELMFAMVIFAIVAGGALAGITAALKTTRGDKARIAASDLAARELEIVRNEFTASSSGPNNLAATLQVVNPHPLPGQTAGYPLTLDNQPFTVTRNVEWLPAGTGQSPCDGGSTVTYPSLGVTVTVTWPNMGNISPVTSSTVLTPSKNTLNSTLGFVAVKVSGADGVPQEDVVVSLTGPGGTFSDTTASDGCAVFATSTPGTYTTSLNTVGYVDNYGNQLASKTVPVTAGTLAQRSFSYDQAATLNVTMVTESGYALPTSFPNVSLANTNLQPLGFLYKVASSATTTITSLWPATDGYTSWAGQCQQADPAASGGTRAAAVVMTPGGTGASTVRLAPVTVTVTKLLVAQSGKTVVAYPVNTTGCATTENPLTLGVTNALGILKTSLPAGAWVIKVSGSTSAAWPTTPVLLPSSGPTAIAVVLS